MPLEGREKGIRSPYTVRFNQGNPYAGVNKQGDAASIPDTQGPEAINVRIVGGRPKSRPGQQKINANALQPIHGFHDPHVETYDSVPATESIVYFMTKNVSTGQIYINEFDTVSLTRTQHAIGTVGLYRMGLYDTDGISDGFLRGSDDKFYIACRKIAGGNCTPVLLQVDGTSWAVVELFLDPIGLVANTGPTFWEVIEDPVNPLVFYITKVTYAVGGNRVYRYDGSGTLDDGSLTFGSQCLRANVSPFNGTFISAWYSDTTVPVRHRTGAATWVALTPPAGPGGYVGGGGSGGVLNGVLYIPVHYSSFNPNVELILSVDGTYAMAEARTIVGSGNHGIDVVQAFNDVLYYLWTDDGDLHLGSYDGVTWDDAIHVFSSSGFGTNLNLVGPSTYMLVYGGATQKLARATDPAGTWTTLYTLPAGESIIATKIFSEAL